MATDAEIEPFIRSFEDGSLPRSAWTHAGHLVLALRYIRRHGRDGATGLIRDGIRRYNGRHGNPTGYHETITLAWVAAIDRFLGDPARPVHTILLGAEIPVVEHLTGLDRLPEEGCRFFAVPVKVKGMGTFPVRAFGLMGSA